MTENSTISLLRNYKNENQFVSGLEKKIQYWLSETIIQLKYEDLLTNPAKFKPIKNPIK